MGSERVSDDVLDVAEMAKITGLHRQKVAELAKRGEIPGFFKLGKRLLFSRRRFEAFLAEPEPGPRRGT